MEPRDLLLALFIAMCPFQVSSHYNHYTAQHPTSNYRRAQSDYYRRQHQTHTKNRVPLRPPAFVEKYKHTPQSHRTMGIISSEKKLNYYDPPTFISATLNKTTDLTREEETFDNFVTPKEENLPRKRYEVTTEKFEDSEPDPFPSGLDGDLTIAIDDGDKNAPEAKGLEYEEEFDQSEEDADEDKYRGPVDSYGHTSGHYYGYGVAHTPARLRKKPAGRIRMQVFRGPNRYVGHMRYAQWGYYVVQPAADSSTNKNHHPLYYS